MKVPDQIDKVKIQNKIKFTAIQTKTIDTKTIKTIDTKILAISKTTDIIIIAAHHTNNKTETTQTNNHVDFVTEQIISPGIVKPVLIAEDWDRCLANVEHHDKVKTIGKKFRNLTGTHKITVEIATQSPLSNKILYTRPICVPGATRRQH